MCRTTWAVTDSGDRTGASIMVVACFEGWSKQGVFRSFSDMAGDERLLQIVKGQLEKELCSSQWGVQASSHSYLSLLRRCIDKKDLVTGKQVQTHMIQTGFKPSLYVANTLLLMYVKCGTLVEARKVFDQLCKRDMFTWTTMLAGYSSNGEFLETFNLYEQMLSQGVTLDRIIYTRVVNACTSLRSLEKGKKVHANIIRSRIRSDTILDNALIDMYAKCGSIKHACQVFDNMAERNVVSWNVMIAGLAQHKCGKEAFELFLQMQWEGMMPDKVTLLSILNASASPEALEQGKLVHSYIIQAGHELSDAHVNNALVSMYAKCGSVESARQVFDQMPNRNVVSWNAMIGGYAAHGQCEEAFGIFNQMHHQGVKPDIITFLNIVKSCCSPKALEQGKWVHAEIMKAGFEFDVRIQTALVRMYSKCGSIEDAWQVFNRMRSRNVISWTAMIEGYVEHGLCEEALGVFHQMQQEPVKPDRILFTCIVSACTSPVALEQGKQVHAYITSCGFESDVHVGPALITMYAQCGSIKEARQVFDKLSNRNVVAWTAMISAYAEHDLHDEAFQVFHQMQQELVEPNRVTYISILNACTSPASLKQGMQVHAQITDAGFGSDVSLRNALITMYIKCGSISAARQVFDDMQSRDVVSWNAIIGGYAQHGYGEDAFNLYRQMKGEGVKPNKITFVSILNTCANLAALVEGMEFHREICEAGLEADVCVGNALIDMYTKSGNIEGACRVFDQMPARDVVSWNAMIGGYAQHGYGNKALELFKQMKTEGFKPDRITFVNVLSACNHAGLVDEGHQHFSSMDQDYKVMPTLDHFCCMVDLLGRTGCLQEAEDFIQRMPFEPDASIWSPLLGACHRYGKVEVVEHVADWTLKLDSQDAAVYVLLSNMYAAAGMWENVEKVRYLMKDRGVKKGGGCSWIRTENKSHEFVAEDR